MEYNNNQVISKNSMGYNKSKLKEEGRIITENTA
jgi:hypothetical protein